MAAPFTKPPLLQESRLTGSGSPNLMVLVEWNVPVERFMGAANSVFRIYPGLYTCTVQTADPNWFLLLALLLYSQPGFPLYEDTDLGRATAHQLYCFAIEVGFGANGSLGTHTSPLVKCMVLYSAVPSAPNQTSIAKQ